MQPPNLPEGYAAISIHLIAELLYGCESLCRLKPLSKTYPTDFTPILQRREIGELIQKLDPNAEKLTVFLYTTHAEVWLTREWLHSNSHLFRIRAEAETKRQKVNSNTELAAKIFERITTIFGLPKDGAAAKGITEISILLAASRDKSYFEQFKCLDLLEEQEKQQQQQQKEIK